MANSSGVAIGKQDRYANVAFGNCTMSAANTLTFSQIVMAVGMFQGMALVLHRVLWFPIATTVRELVAAADSLYLALTTTNRLTALIDITDPAIVVAKQRIGVGANIANEELPWVSDMTMLPGGGKLIAANPLYLAATTGGFANPAQVRAQLDFTFIELKDSDYLELLQAQYPANIT